MANRYWVGGTGTWNTTLTTNWSATSGGAGGASAPTSVDAAIFNANSGVGTVTINENIICLTVSFNGASIGTIDWNNKTITVTGNSATVYTGGAIPPTMTNNPIVIANYSGSTGTRTITGGTTVTEANAVTVKVTAGSDVVTLGSSNNVYKTIDFTGFSGSLSAGNRYIYGSITFPATMTHGVGGGTYAMLASSGSYVIDTSNISIDEGVTLNGAATWTLLSNLTMGSTRTFNLTAGTLNLNNLTLTTGLFSSSNSNVRSIAFGTGNITLTGNASTIFTMAAVIGFTYTGTPVVNAVYSGSTGTRTYVLGSSGVQTESQALSLNVTAGNDAFTFTNGSRLLNLNFTGYSGLATLGTGTFQIYGGLTLSSGMTIASGGIAFSSTSATPRTITTAGKTLDCLFSFNGVGGTFAFQDALTQGSTRAFTITNGTVQLKAGVTSTVGAFATSGSNRKYLQSTIAGSQATLSQASGTVNVNYLTIKDINATGGATWNSFVDQNNVDAGNNEGWDFGISPIIGGTEYTYQLRSFTQPRRF